MTRTVEIFIAVALLVAGLVLALGFPDATFLVFQGRPLGVVLAVIGGLDLAWALGGRRGRDTT